MKHLLLALGIFLPLFAAQAQSLVLPDKKAEAFYELVEETRAFRSINDTIKFTADAVFAKGARVFVTSYSTTHWAACERAGSKYVIPVTALGAYEIDTSDQGSNSIGGNNASGIYTGPRGGVYRINSNGNKTYIKRK